MKSKVTRYKLHISLSYIPTLHRLSETFIVRICDSFYFFRVYESTFPNKSKSRNLQFQSGFGGVPKRTKHGSQPIFSTELGKVVHIFADFGNRNIGGHGNFILTYI